MATRLEIVNAALARIGDDRVQSLPETAEFDPNADDLATTVADVYFQERDALLDGTPWSWLMERYKLPLDAGVAHEGTLGKRPDGRYQFILRNPRVASVRAIFDAERAVVPRVEGWTREGQYILADFKDAWTDDQRQIAEEVFPNLFVRALSLRLTAELALALTEDVPTANKWDMRAQDALADAQRIDAQAKPSEAITDFEWVQQRVSGTYGYVDKRDLASLSEASRSG